MVSWDSKVDNFANSLVVTVIVVIVLSLKIIFKVAVQMLFCGVLPPGLVQYSSRHSCVIAVKLFSKRFVSVQVVHPYSLFDMTAAWKKNSFILSVWSAS